MKIKVARDIEVCKTLWSEFSPLKTLFDTWDFRYIFWCIYNYEPYFIYVEERDGSKKGLLPLWLCKNDNCYYWFGDVGDGFHWQEDNEFWVDSEDILKMLLENIPSQAILNCIKGSMTKWVDKIGLKSANPKNVLGLSGVNSADEYIAGLSFNTRKSVKRKRNFIRKIDPEVVFGGKENFDFMIDINVRKFVDSPFKDARLVEVFRKFLDEKHLQFSTDLISVYLSGELAAVEQIFIFNDIYYPLLFSADTSRFSGVGYYLNLINVENALNHKMKFIDFAEGDSQYYKSSLYPELSQYLYEKE